MGFVYIFYAIGCFFGKVLCDKINPKRAWIVSMVMFAVLTATAGFVVKSHDDMSIYYIYSSAWGMFIGMAICAETVVFSMVIPESRGGTLTG